LLILKSVGVFGSHNNAADKTIVNGKHIAQFIDELRDAARPQRLGEEFPWKAAEHQGISGVDERGVRRTRLIRPQQRSKRQARFANNAPEV